MDMLQLRDAIPSYAKDVWITLDGALNKSGLAPEVAAAAGIAAAISAGSPQLVKAFQGLTTEVEATAAKTAAAIMGMTNIWYSYLDLAEDAELKTQPPQIRMQGYATHGGVDKKHFEIYTLAASIVGKCRGCVSGHIAELKKLGITPAELRDIGKLAAAVNATSKLIKLN
ncbi:carboxymuconolactone decarboxylase family protein [Collimonas humicola]|uniref:carboxymuconolactone decarboxylase family protein n=1 Tax=Collimonas humicola TaxID=2825886 RepID=UPI001B8B3A29|nr:carboxymuconolactone decarboxylase family protein [Collimonas humicola]